MNKESYLAIYTLETKLKFLIWMVNTSLHNHKLWETKLIVTLNALLLFYRIDISTNFYHPNKESFTAILYWFTACFRCWCDKRPKLWGIPLAFNTRSTTIHSFNAKGSLVWTSVINCESLFILLKLFFKFGRRNYTMVRIN